MLHAIRLMHAQTSHNQPIKHDNTNITRKTNADPTWDGTPQAKQPLRPTAVTVWVVDVDSLHTKLSSVLFAPVFHQGLTSKFQGRVIETGRRSVNGQRRTRLFTGPYRCAEFVRRLSTDLQCKTAGDAVSCVPKVGWAFYCILLYLR